MLDGDEGLAQALRFAPHTVIGVGEAVLPAHGLVGAAALDGLAGAAGVQLFHQTHSVEEALLFALLFCKKQIPESSICSTQREPNLNLNPLIQPVTDPSFL